MKVIVMYLPVPHSGYKEFFKRNQVDSVFILNDEIINEFRHLRKNLSALNSVEVQTVIQALGWSSGQIRLAGRNTLGVLNLPDTNVIMPDDDVSRAVAEKYLDFSNITFDHTFLRWDMRASTKNFDVSPDTIISEDVFDLTVMAFLEREKLKSSDFWRQVACAVVKEGHILHFAYNKHAPDPESPYIYGDPRMHFSRGVEIDIGTGEHAEARLIALCARQGLSTEGSSLYVTTFPCPPCAKAVATAGFTKCYFRHGYGRLDAELILKSAGIEIIQIK